MFIKKIIFGGTEKCFEPNGEIEFRDSQSELIDFYLKTVKKIKEGEKDIGFSERFKINCILGNNGGGKTKLLSSILHFFHSDGRWKKEGKTLIMGNAGSEKIYEMNYSGFSLPTTLPRAMDGTPGELRANKVCCIFDDFFVGSDMFQYSVNKNVAEQMLSKGGLNGFYCEINNFLFSKETNYKIFSEFLNLGQKAKHFFRLSWDTGWKGSRGIEFLRFWEEDGHKGTSDEEFGDNERVITDALPAFEFLNWVINNKSDTLKKNYPNLSASLRDEALAKDLWLANSELFLAMLNGLRSNLGQYHIDSKPEDFIKQRGYAEFKRSLDLLNVYLEIIIDERSLKDSLEKISGSIGPKDAPKFKHVLKWLALTRTNLSRLISVLNTLEKEGRKTAEQACKKHFGYGLHDVLKRISGYEAFRVGASPYFLTELLGGFSDGAKADCVRRGYAMNTAIELGVKDPAQDRLTDEIILQINGCLNDIETRILEFPFFKVDLFFENEDGRKKSFENLSSGEKIMLVRFVNVYTAIQKKYDNKDMRHFVILIDEPDLHLHLDWQRKYVQRLVDVFSTLELPGATFHFILATHSPFIISDIASDNIVVLKREGQTSMSQKYDGQSFGASYLDLLEKGFFQDNILLGAFATSVIGGMGKLELLTEMSRTWGKKKVQDFSQEIGAQELLKYMNTHPDWANRGKSLIGDNFISENLSYFGNLETHAADSNRLDSQGHREGFSHRMEGI